MNEYTEKFGRQAVGMLMADQGLKYTREMEEQLISKMYDNMIEKLGYTKKTAVYYLDYDEDFIGDNLQCLPRG
jgi:hypothetical protein